MIHLRRFRFIPFWRLTDWGCHLSFMGGPILWPNKACDEYHNPSRFVIVPLVGEFVLFAKGYNTDQPEHLYAYNPQDGWLGADVVGCHICTDIKEEA